MKTFNYKDNINYDDDRYSPGLYRLHVGKYESPYHIVLGEFVHFNDMQKYVQNAFPKMCVTDIDYIGSRANMDNFDSVVESLMATPFNRKLFKGPQSMDDWMQFHKNRTTFQPVQDATETEDLQSRQSAFS